MGDKANPFLKSTKKTQEKLVALSTTISNYIREKILSEGVTDIPEDKVKDTPEEIPNQKAIVNVQ